MSPRRLFVVPILLVGLACIQERAFAESAESNCGGSLPNVVWSFVDSVAGCPAGDSLGISSRPAILRINLFYTDGSVCLIPQVDVPPESIWVTVTELAGNLKINDHADKIFADDSTDALGSTTFRIRSFSGCGTIKLNFFVSGIAKGDEIFTVRTTDTNADGRTTSSDVTGVCDLDYDGTAGDLGDLSFIQRHQKDHWHRQALHGTLVRRTNLEENGELGDANTLGDSELFWSPDGRNTSFSVFKQQTFAPDTIDCHVFHVPSDPKDGNTLTHFTFPPNGTHDYNPSWSPLGTDIAWDRGDSSIYRKGIPGINPDTTEHRVIHADVGELNRGATFPAYSPDGRWIAFTLKELDGRGNLWKILVADTSQKVRLTSDLDVSDIYPRWSPDGTWITFDRVTGGVGKLHRLWKVRGDLDSPPSPTLVLATTPDSLHVTMPQFSPDSLIIVFGAENPDTPDNTVVTKTIDPLLPVTQKGIINYPDHTIKSGASILALSARLSPDGSRLALRARPPSEPGELPQLWAVRRNMNLPPTITKIGSKTIGEDTVTVHFDAEKSKTLTLALLSSDPEGDDITCSAFFLRDDLDMEFNTTTCVFTWKPKQPQVDSTFNVKFHVSTPSGGVDVVIAQITVTPSGGGSAPIISTLGQPGLQNPSRGTFALATPNIPGEVAKLRVYNLSGRLVARVEGKAGTFLVWNGREASGVRVPSGIYFYRLEVGRIQERGKWVLIR